MKVYILTLSAVLLIASGAQVAYTLVGSPDCRLFCSDSPFVVAGYRNLWAGAAASFPSAGLEDFRNALRNNPASPYRWCDLGEALLRSGDEKAARYCFRQALALSPHGPPILLRAANFYLSVQDKPEAFANLAQVLQNDAYYAIVFNYFDHFGFDTKDILDRGMPTQDAAKSWFLHLMETKTIKPEVFAWLTAHQWADDILFNKYLELLLAHNQYAEASQACSLYRESKKINPNVVFNGEFEQTQNSTLFDWNLDIKAVRDSSHAHSGAWSLRLDSLDSLRPHSPWQLALVKPGAYVFQGFVESEAGGDPGITFHIFDRLDPSRLDVTAERPNTAQGWQTVRKEVTIPEGTRLLQIEIIRSNRGGPAWIDSVTLTNS